MNALRTGALALIIAGALALGYGGFSYTQDTHDVDIGPVHLSVEENKRVNIPLWAGISAIVIGGLLLVMRPQN